MTKKMSKVGLFSVGLDTYWKQFDSLLDNLNGYHGEIKKKIKQSGVEVVDAGMVDNTDKAAAAIELFNSNQVELIFLFVSTYALSSTILPIALQVKRPFVILNLQPVESLDYDKFNTLDDYAKKTGLWLEHCQACAIPEISCVLNKAAVRYEIITGYLQEERVWDEIESWIKAVKVVKALQENNMGLIGNYYGGMLDVYSDLTRLSSTFGTYFDIIEMCELKSIRD